MTKKDKKAIEDAFVRIHEKDPKCSSCIFRTEWENIGKLLRNILENNQPKVEYWIDHDKHIECGCCNTWYLKDYLVRNSYCPNCGAKLGHMKRKRSK